MTYRSAKEAAAEPVVEALFANPGITRSSP